MLYKNTTAVTTCYSYISLLSFSRTIYNTAHNSYLNIKVIVSNKLLNL